MNNFEERVRNACRVTFIESMGDDIRVADAARVSFDKAEGETLTERGKRLIAYLAANDHWTPFGHVVVTIRIDAPIFVARQWFRSTVGVARNEVSRRYVDSPPEYFLPDVFHGRPAGSIKQGAGDEHPDSEGLKSLVGMFYAHADQIYRELIGDGVAPEEARMVLPMGSFTSWYETGSLTYFARVAGLRLDSHAQGATGDLARLVEAAIEPVAPVSWDALMKKAGDRG